MGTRLCLESVRRLVRLCRLDDWLVWFDDLGSRFYFRSPRKLALRHYEKGPFVFLQLVELLDRDHLPSVLSRIRVIFVLVFDLQTLDAFG